MVPIPVRLARDDDLDSDSDLEADGDLEKEDLPPPPPAYGLWRSSVRVDPNLLHWQRVEESRAQSAISMPRSRNGSMVAASTHDVPPAATNDVGPRPPSYVSEDGVTYITEAAPRSVAPASAPSPALAPAPAPAPSGIHPAWRTSYVMSEIRPGEVPASMGRR